MTLFEFQTQMNRLVEQYKNHYSPERIKLIFREVKEFPAAWWERTVDQLLSSCRQAPLLYPDIAEHIARQREKRNFQEKKEHEADAKAFWEKSLLTDSDRSHIMDAIQKRANGLMNDSDWASVMQMLDGIAEMCRCQECQQNKHERSA